MEVVLFNMKPRPLYRFGVDNKIEYDKNIDMIHGIPVTSSNPISLEIVTTGVYEIDNIIDWVHISDEDMIHTFELVSVHEVDMEIGSNKGTIYANAHTHELQKMSHKT